jgi:hypothetical protein
MRLRSFFGRSNAEADANSRRDDEKQRIKERVETTRNQVRATIAAAEYHSYELSTMAGMMKMMGSRRERDH